MSGTVALVAAYAGAALLYGLYAYALLRRERRMERNRRHLREAGDG